MCFKSKESSHSLNGQPLDLVDQFPYLRGNISSTDIDVNIRIVKVWTASES